jgi:PEP-CTERM motif
MYFQSVKKWAFLAVAIFIIQPVKAYDLIYISQIHRNLQSSGGVTAGDAFARIDLYSETLFPGPFISVTAPNGFATQVPTFPFPNGGQEILSFPNSASLDAAFPSGNYFVNTGDVRPICCAPVAINIPTAATVSTFTNADEIQGRNPSLPIIIRFTPASRPIGIENFLRVISVQNASEENLYSSIIYAPINATDDSFNLSLAGLSASSNYKVSIINSSRIEATTGSDPFFIGARDDWTTLYFSTGAASVPEPSSWTLLITGFGLVGFAARRRMGGATSFSRY